VREVLKAQIAERPEAPQQTRGIDRLTGHIKAPSLFFAATAAATAR